MPIVNLPENVENAENDDWVISKFRRWLFERAAKLARHGVYMCPVCLEHEIYPLAGERRCSHCQEI